MDGVNALNPSLTGTASPQTSTANAASVDYDAFLTLLVAQLRKLAADEDHSGFARISFQRYLNISRPPIPLRPQEQTDAIGVVVVAGPIVNGEQPPGVAAGETVAGLLRDARNDDNIKGVLMRVDTGGGSAFASEIIREQVSALQAAGKPVVVSMSGAAASGGYWISAGADEVWANNVESR